MPDRDATNRLPTASGEETSTSATDTLGDADRRDSRRAFARASAVFALVAASPGFQLAMAGQVAWATFAVAAIGGALLGVVDLVWRPLRPLADWLRRVVGLTLAAAAVVGVAWVVFVLDPTDVRFASASLGVLLGAFAVRVGHHQRFLDGGDRSVGR